MLEHKIKQGTRNVFERKAEKRKNEVFAGKTVCDINYAEICKNYFT